MASEAQCVGQPENDWHSYSLCKEREREGGHTCTEGGEGAHAHTRPIHTHTHTHPHPHARTHSRRHTNTSVNTQPYTHRHTHKPPTNTEGLKTASRPHRGSLQTHVYWVQCNGNSCQNCTALQSVLKLCSSCTVAKQSHWKHVLSNFPKGASLFVNPQILGLQWPTIADSAELLDRPGGISKMFPSSSRPAYSSPHYSQKNFYNNRCLGGGGGGGWWGNVGVSGKNSCLIFLQTFFLDNNLNQVQSLENFRLEYQAQPLGDI